QHALELVNAGAAGQYTVFRTQPDIAGAGQCADIEILGQGVVPGCRGILIQAVIEIDAETILPADQPVALQRASGGTEADLVNKQERSAQQCLRLDADGGQRLIGYAA